MQLQYAERAPAQNVSTRRNGSRPEMRPTAPRPRHIAPRPRQDPRHISPRPRHWGCCLRRDRDETLVHLETVSRPRRLDRDHIPGNKRTALQSQLGTHSSPSNSVFKHLNSIFPHTIRTCKTFCPRHENATLQSLLHHWKWKCEAWNTCTI